MKLRVVLYGSHDRELDSVCFDCEDSVAGVEVMPLDGSDSAVLTAMPVGKAPQVKPRFAKAKPSTAIKPLPNQQEFTLEA